MRPSTKTYVLDASALLNYLKEGTGAQTVVRLMREASRSEAILAMSALNLGEVFYLLWMRGGEQEARNIMSEVQLLPIEIISVDPSLAFEASAIKAVHKVPYVDSVAAALAVRYRATLVTSDSDFEKLGRRIPVLWLRHP